MTQEIWTMSAREIDRLAILERVESAGLRLDQAPRLAFLLQPAVDLLADAGG